MIYNKKIHFKLSLKKNYLKPKWIIKLTLFFMFDFLATKPPERTVSPMPIMTNNTNTSSPTNGHSNSSTPANAFAGAIKSLTQKYRTMHLSSNENQNNTINLSSTNNNNNSSNSGNRRGWNQ